MIQTVDIKYLCPAIILLGSLLQISSVQSAPLRVDADKQQGLSVTLYNQDLGLVRDVRNLPPINQGQTLYIEDVSHQIMSETLQIENAGKVLEQNLNNNLISTGALLKAYIGKPLQLARFNSVSGTETITDARLLSVQGNQAVVEHQGRIETLPVNQQGWRFIFPKLPDGMQARPSLEIRSQGTKKASEAVLTYLTRGLNWQMDYALVLQQEGTQLSLDGMATLRNQTGVDFKNSQILLMAGQVNQPPRVMQQRFKAEAMLADAAPRGGSPEAFQDYQLYRLPQQANLLNGQTKQVSLISAEQIKSSKSYHYRFPVFPSLDRQSYDQKPDIKVSFENKASDGLGFPLPAGTARVFSPDSEGLRHFIGSAQIRHTSKGQKVELAVGKAFDITIKRRQTEFKKNYDSHLVTQEITLLNSRKQSATVNLNADFSQPWKIRDSNHPFTKINASQNRWQIEVPGEGQVTLRFKAELTKR